MGFDSTQMQAFSVAGPLGLGLASIGKKDRDLSRKAKTEGLSPIEKMASERDEKEFKINMTQIGWDMIGSGLAKGLNRPEYAQRYSQIGKHTTDMMRKKWWRQEAEIFNKQYEKPANEKIQGLVSDFNEDMRIVPLPIHGDRKITRKVNRGGQIPDDSGMGQVSGGATKPAGKRGTLSKSAGGSDAVQKEEFDTVEDNQPQMVDSLIGPQGAPLPIDSEQAIEFLRGRSGEVIQGINQEIINMANAAAMFPDNPFIQQRVNNLMAGYSNQVKMSQQNREETTNEVAGFTQAGRDKELFDLEKRTKGLELDKAKKDLEGGSAKLYEYDPDKYGGSYEASDIVGDLDATQNKEFKAVVEKHTEKYLVRYQEQNYAASLNAAKRKAEKAGEEFDPEKHNPADEYIQLSSSQQEMARILAKNAAFTQAISQIRSKDGVGRANRELIDPDFIDLEMARSGKPWVSKYSKAKMLANKTGKSLGEIESLLREVGSLNGVERKLSGALVAKPKKSLSTVEIKAKISELEEFRGAIGLHRTGDEEMDSLRGAELREVVDEVTLAIKELKATAKANAPKDKEKANKDKEKANASRKQKVKENLSSYRKKKGLLE